MKIISSDLKPLYADLKELSIGVFLQSREFDLYSIRNNFDNKWKEYIKEAGNGRVVMMLGHLYVFKLKWTFS